MSTSTGRIPSAARNKAHLYDAPETTVSAILDNQDQLIDKVAELITAIKGIAAKLDLDATVTDTDYASLHTDSVSDDIQKLDLME